MNGSPDERYKSRAVGTDSDASRSSSISARVFDFPEKWLVAKCLSRLLKGSTIADAVSGTGRRTSSPRTCFATARSTSGWTCARGALMPQFMTPHLS